MMKAVFRIPVGVLLVTTVACHDQVTEPPSPEVLTEASRAGRGSQLRSICDADNGGLSLPGGFCAVVVHDATTPTGEPARARHLVVRSNGDVYVAIDSEGGGVLALRDTDGDGKADETAMFGSGPGHGIALREPFLYFAPDDRVERYLLSEDGLTPVSGPEVIVSGMPDDGDHVTKSIAVSADGTLFVNLGSASDVCQEVNRQPASPGVDPCPELPIRSGIWRYNADQPGQVHAEEARFATGTRNMVALALNPFNGDLYGVQHGRDNLNVYWPDLFTPQDQAELPAEEFFRFVEGADYGWPYCYFDGREERKVLGPEYGGDGEIQGRCGSTELPIDHYPAHWAPNGLLFYSGSQFPTRYREGAFIAFHGGFNRPDPFQDEGFNVTFVPFRGGLPSGAAEVFADGFIGAGGDELPGDAEHRPTGVAEGPDGSLYISDDQGGRIYRVVHASARSAVVTQFRAHAHGGEEVPPVDTRAQGQAVFRLSADGSEVAYKLTVANIENVTQAHIHIAPAGENGPVAVWLYPSGPPPQPIQGRTQGVLAEGVITSEDLVGPLEGMGLDALLEALQSGNAYVNVHTEANPAGEIRGQIG